ncbi:MAG: DUF3795 domain-containing protein [Deltaproteobacteria bacterium]|nr:DUF3795 domain-containing protein [Deltaproteobacteria bacterium]
MKGWKEEEFKNKDLMASTRDNNEKFRTVMANLYGTKPEETECMGCMQSEPTKKQYAWCQSCKIRSCVKTKGHYSCHQCEEWPCDMIENFGFATGVRVMKKTIPVWRDKSAEHGHEKGSVEWARSECERYHCSSCGEPLFRGAQRCRACKHDVTDELDGSL